MIRRHGGQWVWQVEGYLDDPLYDKLLHTYADPNNWHNECRKGGVAPAKRGVFSLTASSWELTGWFKQGRERDVYEFTEWGLNNLNYNPHIIEEVGYPSLLEEMNYCYREPVQLLSISSDYLLEPSVTIPRRFSGFTRLTMARTVCAVMQGNLPLERIEEPRLAAAIRSAMACRNGALAVESLKEHLKSYVSSETTRAGECLSTAVRLVSALQSNENFAVLFSAAGGTKMTRPTTHRAIVDSPKDVANRLLFYYRLCQIHGLMALETLRLPIGRMNYSRKPTWDKEPDPLIRHLLQLVTDGIFVEEIAHSFGDLFQRQFEDRTAIAAWALYAWGTNLMTAAEVAKVLISCLEEGRPLPRCSTS
jgi:hypothetical protein